MEREKAARAHSRAALSRGVKPARLPERKRE